MTQALPKPLQVGSPVSSVTIGSATLQPDGSIVCVWSGLDANGNVVTRQRGYLDPTTATPLLAGPGSGLLTALASALATQITSSGATFPVGPPAPTVLPPGKIPTVIGPKG